MSKFHGIEDNMTPFLDLDELERESYNPNKSKKFVFKLILKKCHDRIRKINKENDNKACYFDIPLMMLGYPRYDMEMVNYFLITQLTQNGLYAERINSQKIYISWSQQHVNQDLYHERSQKAVQKNNIYKIKHSPLEDELQNTKEEKERTRPRIIKESQSSLPINKKNKNKCDYERNDGIPVTLLQYDGSVDDMIPINTKKYNNYS